MRKYFNDNPESFMQNWDNYPVFNQNPCTLVILVSLGIVVSCPCWFLEHPPQAYQVYSILLNPRTFQASLLIPLQLYCTEELHTCLLFVYITSSTGNFQLFVLNDFLQNLHQSSTTFLRDMPALNLNNFVWNIRQLPTNHRGQSKSFNRLVTISTQAFISCFIIWLSPTLSCW
jgi:hypothetical protein